MFFLFGAVSTHFTTMNVKITDITTRNIKTDDEIDPSKVNKMLFELVKNPKGCERVPFVKSSVVSRDMKLYVNIPYIATCAYDYPFMPFEVFSVNEKERKQILQHIKQRYYDWIIEGDRYTKQLILMVEENVNEDIPMGVAFLVYTYDRYEPLKVQFDEKLLGKNFGLSDSFGCGCIRCVDNPKNELWDLFTVTNSTLINHLQSDEHHENAKLNNYVTKP